MDREKSRYTPSGLPVTVVLYELFQNDNDWTKTMEGPFRGAIFEEDILHAKQYRESHEQEVMAELIKLAEEQQ